MFLYLVLSEGHTACLGIQGEAIYFRGDCLYESLFSLIMWAKTNNRMMQKGKEMLGGIKSSSFLTPKTCKKETMEIAEGHYNNSFQKSCLGRACTMTECGKETELCA